MIWQEIAEQIGAIPLLWLALLAANGKPRERQWWMLAIAFFISWMTDEAARPVWGLNSWVLSMVFPVSQTALIGAVFLDRAPAVVLTMVLTGVGCLAVAIQGVEGPDVILSTIAACTVVWMVWNHPARKARLALVVYFGLGQIAWLIHARWLIVPTWFPYQMCRLAGLLLFCWATWNVKPSLSLRTS